LPELDKSPDELTIAVANVPTTDWTVEIVDVFGSDDGLQKEIKILLFFHRTLIFYGCKNAKR